MRPLHPKGLILTDLDGTMLGAREYFDGVGEALEALEMLGFTVVPVTAKSIWEIVHLWLKLLGRPPAAAVAESGGAIYAVRGLLAEPSGVLEDLGLEYVELGPRLEEAESLILEALSGCRGYLRLSRAGPREASIITGLPPGRAALAARRLYLEVIWHPRGECLDRAASRAWDLGLYVHRSRRLLHLGVHRGKGRAVSKLLAEPAFSNPTLIVAAGDSEADEGFMGVADVRVVIPSDSPSRPKLADYMPVPYPAPEGWVEAMKLVVLKAPLALRG